MINTLLGMVIDTDLMRPHLGGVTGGLSGPGIRPVAVRAIWQVRQAMAEGRIPVVPIIGVGGVRTGRDALELVAAGASAVQVGTAVFNDPTAPVRVLRELCRAARRQGLRAVHRRRRRRARPLTPSTAPTAEARRPTRPSHRHQSSARRPTMSKAFGARLARPRCAAHGPLCAGIDPHRALVEAWGLTYDVAGLERFALTCVEAFAGRVAAVKPQSAFFEVFGSRGSPSSSGCSPSCARPGR